MAAAWESPHPALPAPDRSARRPAPVSDRQPHYRLWCFGADRGNQRETASRAIRRKRADAGMAVRSAAAGGSLARWGTPRAAAPPGVDVGRSRRDPSGLGRDAPLPAGIGEQVWPAREKKVIAVVGVSRKGTPHLRLMLRKASEHLKFQWRWGVEDGADLVVIDPSTFSGKLAPQPLRRDRRALRATARRGRQGRRRPAVAPSAQAQPVPRRAAPGRRQRGRGPGTGADHR